jgi:polysaccharide biosynthesis/export protein
MKRILLALVAIVFASTAFAQSDYRIRSGDTLKIEVLEDSTLSRNVLVTPGGTINFPYVGAVTAAGQTATQIEAAIRSGIASNFAAPPTVFVSLNSVSEPAPARGGNIAAAAPAGIKIYLLGEIADAGVKEVAAGTTFLQILAQGGGFTKFAATKRVQLRRRDAASGLETIYKINYKDLSEGATLDSDVVLQAGDVIIVPERKLFE